MTDMSQPTSYETGTAEAWLTVLDYVSRVAQAVEGGDWYYLVDKSNALERAVKALRGRVWDDDTNRPDIEDPETGKPLRGEAVMEVVQRNAGLYRASRALYSGRVPSDRGAFPVTDGLRQRPGDQPLPRRQDAGPVIHDLVAADLAERLRLGVSRYGTPLRAYNGRDALRDLYEELLDAAVYARQLLEERDGVRFG